MEYRVVYDVRDEAWYDLQELPFMLAWLGFMLFWTFMLSRAYREKMRTDPDLARGMRIGFVFGFVFIAVGCWALFAKVVPAYDDRQLCQRWLDGGNNTVVEGTIDEFEPRRKQPPRYRVGNVWLNPGGDKGGFRGDFTAADAKNFSLDIGMKVRFTTREERILRIEIEK